MTKPKILGIITARGGSKGIPGKNIKSLLGKPLIAYTIDAAKESGVIDRLILSTDDPAIAEVAKQYGCEVPFMRPADISDDKSAHLPVLQHAVKALKEKDGYEPDYVLLLQPTSPARQAFHIKEAAGLMEKSGADSVLSVAEIPENYHYKKAMFVDESRALRLVKDVGPIYERVSRRQDLEKNYWSVGSIYLFKTSLLFDPAKPNFYGEKTMPYIVDAKYVVDINVPADWEAAEKALKRLTTND
ncbi:MAG: acylneuraminate cytidylyltransferase family protein [bacterium]|nr:acylneuraminate cytidylyltransferase family protein [bacterium]